jgi:hypothetical protein
MVFLGKLRGELDHNVEYILASMTFYIWEVSKSDTNQSESTVNSQRIVMFHIEAVKTCCYGLILV